MPSNNQLGSRDIDKSMIYGEDTSVRFTAEDWARFESKICERIKESTHFCLRALDDSFSAERKK